MFKNENFDAQNVCVRRIHVSILFLFLRICLLQLMCIVQHLSTELGKVVFGLFRWSKLYFDVRTKYNG